MSQYEYDYLKLLTDIRDNGVEFNNRTGTPCKQLFGYQITVNLKDGFPILTTKRISFKSVVGELLWFLSGSDNISYLQNNNIKIWNEWADNKGSIGPMYGVQWTNWNGLNQIDRVISEIKKYPNSRRLLVSAWNSSYIPDNTTSPSLNPSMGKMALAPCHPFFQFFVNIKTNELSCLFFMRSNDVFLGLPFNIASYALLTHIIAAECNLGVGSLIYQAGNAHLYTNHLHQVETQLSRQKDMYKLPTLSFTKKNSIYGYHIDDFVLNNYQYHNPIKAPIAI